MAMSDAALLHAERMARGEESYQGKLLEARDQRLQGRIRPFGYFGADHRARLGSFFRRRANDAEGGAFLSSFWLTADMVPNFVDYRRSEHFWNKGYSGL